MSGDLTGKPQACPYDPYPELPELRDGAPQVCAEDNMFRVECPCGARGPECTTRDEAIERWNAVMRRPVTP